jgi:hypothetical protein
MGAVLNNVLGEAMKKTLAVLLLLLLVVGCGKSEQAGNQSSEKSKEAEPASAQNNVNLSECPDCGREVSIRALQCPHCGAPLTEKEAIAALEKLGAHVTQDSDGKVVTVNLFNCSHNNAGMVHLKGLTKLNYLTLPKHATAGFEHLEGLTSLESLKLLFTQITDADLVHLKGLTKLQRLDLSYTEITDAGLAELQKALPNCEIRAVWRGECSNTNFEDKTPGTLLSTCHP